MGTEQDVPKSQDTESGDNASQQQEQSSQQAESQQGQTQQPQPAQGGQETQIPEQYRGKTAEELAKIAQESQEMVNRQSKEVGDLRQKQEQYEQYLQQVQNQQMQSQQYPGGYPSTQQQQGGYPQQQGASQQSQVTDDSFWESPTKSVQSMIDSAVSQTRSELQSQTLSTLAPRIKKEAVESNPDLFKGVDGDVEKFLQNAYRTRQISADLVANPQTWKTVAIMLKNQKGEPVVLNQPKTVNPVPPTPTETPSTASQKGGKPKELTDSEKLVAQELRISEEEMWKRTHGGEEQ